MIITNALVACFDVVVNRKSTQWAERAGFFFDFVGAHNHERESVQVTPYRLGTNSISTPMPVVLLPYMMLDGKWDYPRGQSA